MGWILIMFDLPVVEKEERRAAARFRLELLDHGYFMLQESVYVRNCVSQEKHTQYLRELRAFAPEEGLINAFFITDKQWESSLTLTLVRSKRPKYNIEAGEPMPAQMTFW